MVTALGLHETRINGAKVGVEALAPGWTDYNRRVQYRILDVTSQVRQGGAAGGPAAPSAPAPTRPRLSEPRGEERAPTARPRTPVRPEGPWRTPSSPIR